MKKHEVFFKHAEEIVRLWIECRKCDADPSWLQDNNPLTFLTPNARVEFSKSYAEIIIKNPLFDRTDYPEDVISDEVKHLREITSEIYPKGPEYIVHQYEGGINVLCQGIGRRKEGLFRVSFENGEIRTSMTSMSHFDIAVVLAWYDDIQSGTNVGTEEHA